MWIRERNDLDVGVRDAGAIGEGGNWWCRGVLQEGKHVGGSLSEVLIGADFWERDGVREPIDGEGVTDAESGWDVTLVASVMLGGWANVPAVNTVWSHVVALVRCDVDDDAGAGRGERALVKVEGAVEAGVSGEFGLAA